MALGTDSKDGTGVDRFLIYENGTRAAGAAIANALGAGEVELIAQRVQQRDPGLKLRAELFAVHVKRYRYLAGTLSGRLAFRQRQCTNVADERNGGGYAGDFQKVAAGNSGAGAGGRFLGFSWLIFFGLVRQIVHRMPPLTLDFADQNDSKVRN